MPLIPLSNRKRKILYDIGSVKKSEVGLQTVNWDRLGSDTYNPDDIGIGTYKDMMKGDSQIRAAYTLVKLAMLSRNWKVVIPESKKKSKEIVQFLRYTFDHMDGRLSGALSNLLLAIPYGFSVSEIVYRMIDEGKFRGKIGIRKLKGLDPEQIEFRTDKFGNLKQVLQDTGELDQKPIKLPIERLLIYSNDKEFGNYYGASRLRAVYKHWFIKDVVTKFWNIALERFGMPMLIGKVPSSKDLDEMKDVLDNAQAKSSLATVEGWEVAALETGIGRSSGGDYVQALDYHNAEIFKGMLIPGTLVGGEAGGSFAKAKVSFELFQLVLKSLEADLGGMIENYLIKPLVAYNYGEMDEYPQFVFEPLTRAEFLELAKVFALLVRNGVVGADETWIRDMLRVPKRSEATITRDTGEIGTGEEKVPIPPAETRIIKTETGGKAIASPTNKKTVKKPTQQVKTPRTSRTTGV
jgi:phage gp29-like protein